MIMEYLGIEFYFFTAVEELPAYTKNLSGARFLAVVLFIVTCVAPLIEFAVCASLWLPMSPHLRDVLVVWVKRIFSWCALDALWVGTLAASLE